MGGSQSAPSPTKSSPTAVVTDYPLLFDYECNEHVADFIQNRPEFLEELKRTIQAYADVCKVTSDHSKGIVILKAKLSASASDKDTCKQKLDEFFSRFLSFEEALEKRIHTHTLNEILNSPGLRCTAVQNSLLNSIRITGIQEDVRTMIFLLREVQNPPIDSEPEAEIPEAEIPVPMPTSPFSVSTTSIQPDSFVSTFDIGPIPAQQNKPVPMPRNSSFSQPLSTFLVYSFQAPEFSVARFIKYSQEHTTKLDQALSHLSQAVTIDASDPKNIEYNFRPVHDLRISEEKFEESCRDELLKFLNDYSSIRKHFNIEQLERARERNPEFFAKKSNEENGGVFIQWYFDDGLLRMAGLKTDVERKEKEIQEFLNTTAPKFGLDVIIIFSITSHFRRLNLSLVDVLSQLSKVAVWLFKYVSSRFVFRYFSQEFSVARFIKYSRIHSPKLEDELKDLATVKIWFPNEKGKDKEKEKEKRLEYQCRPIQGLELRESDFRSKCQNIVRKFLEQYDSVLKSFDRDHLSKVYDKHPNFFEKQTVGEKDRIFVEWQMERYRVRVVGLKKDVSSKLREISNFINTAEPRSLSSKHVFKLKAPDHSVARFIKHSPLHVSQLQTALSHLATVRIWISAEKGDNDDKIIEYQCRPVDGLDVSGDEFDKDCRQTISDVLERYSSIQKFFNHDHLMKVVLKEKDFFKNQTQQENQELFVEWQLIKNRVRIAGLKEDVDAKLRRINDFMDAAAPKTLRQAYEFEFEAPNMQIAMFIKQSQKHTEAFKDAIEDAKVWITPGKRFLHFKATTELTQLDVPQFEEKCKKSTDNFFKKFGIWRNKYSAAVLANAQEQNPHLFSNDDNDFQVEIVNNNELKLIGFKPAFTKMRATLMDTMQKLIGENTKVKSPKKPLPILRTYIYQPKANANKTIIKHLFQSPIDLQRLQEMLGAFIQFNVFPDSENPEGMEFFPKPNIAVNFNYYTKEMPNNIRKFLSQYLVSRKRCTKPHEERQAIDQVYRIGMENRIPQKVISIHKDNDFMNIAGPRVIIEKITQAIDGCNCFGENINLRLAADSAPENPPKRDPPCSSRKSSSSSQPGDAPLPKPRSTIAKPAAPEKAPEKKQPPMNYCPKQKFAPMFAFAWDTPRFREELKSRLDDLCTLTGNSTQVKASAKTEKKDPLFSKKVVERMESFLSSIEITSSDLDDDVIKYLQKNAETWLQHNYDPADWVELSVAENSIELKGFKEAVDKYKAIIEKQIEIDEMTTEAPSEICRVLSVCGVIAEANRQLGTMATITAKIDEGLIICKGKKFFLTYAMTVLADAGHLVEEPPSISEEKMKALQKFLTDKKHNQNEEIIRKKFAERNIKCVVILQSDKVILTAMTKEMHKKGSKCIENNLMNVKDIPLSSSFEKDVFKQNGWDVVIDKIQSENPIMVQIQDASIRLIGLGELENAEDKINVFLAQKMTTSRQIKCKEYVGRFILKHCVPSNLEVTESPPGLLISGPTVDVNAFVDTLKAAKWRRTQLTYAAPNMLSFFNSQRWKDSTKVLEHDIRCTVFCDTTKCKNQGGIEEEPISAPGTSSQIDFSKKVVKEATYGSIKVSVLRGDITAEGTDVIINGVIGREFDLSRGAVSSAILERAGPQMQAECRQETSPRIRATRGWNLLCEHVIHIVTPNKSDQLTKLVKEALDLADLLKATSVAIPTIGAGGIGLAAHDVAAAFSQAIELFARQIPRHVKAIRIVVWEPQLVDLFSSIIVQAKELMGIGTRAAELAESRARSMLKDDEVLVCLNTDDPASLNNAKAKVNQLMSNVIVRKILKENILSELEDNDRFDIFEAAMKHKALVTFNYMSSEIVLRGLSDNVTKLYDAIREVFFEVKEAKAMSKMAVWKWAPTSNVFTSLPLRVSRAIEKEYENNKTGTQSVPMYGSLMTIDFSKSSYDFRMISGKIKREDKDAMSNYPSDWIDMMGKAMIKVTLDKSSAEFSRVSKLFRLSNPTYVGIVKIERVQNPSLYLQYDIYKRSVKQHMITTEPVERELFHGTDAAGIESILQSGFDRNFAGKNATAYGKGCYFAVNSSFSVRYAEANSMLKYMILARVVTGDFCKGSASMKAPPEKPSTGDSTRNYDSTVDDETNPSIFAVFKDASVYPSYLITFH